MVSQITWTLFLTTTAGGLLIYYGCIAMVFYRRQLRSLLVNEKNLLSGLRQAGATYSLMGAVAEGGDQTNQEQYMPDSKGATNPLQAAVSVFTGDEDNESSYFLVASNTEGTPVIELAPRELSSDSLLTGNVADLMDAIQTLLRVISDGEGNSEDIRNFFPSLLAQYQTVAESKYRYSINQFIHDHCRAMLHCDMPLEQVNNLWNFRSPQQAA